MARPRAQDGRGTGAMAADGLGRFPASLTPYPRGCPSPWPNSRSSAGGAHEGAEAAAAAAHCRGRRAALRERREIARRAEAAITGPAYA